MQRQKKKIDYWKLEAWSNLLLPFLILIAALLATWLIPIVAKYKQH